MNKFEMPNIEIVSFTQFDAIAYDLENPGISPFDSEQIELQ